MNWINICNYLFVAMILSSLTGTIFFLIWLLFNKTVLSGDCVLSEKLLRVTMHTYWIPVLFVVLMIRYQDDLLQNTTIGKDEHTIVKYCMLEMSPAIMRGIMIVMTVWMLGIVGISIYWIWQYVNLRMILRGSVPETDAHVLEHYEQALRIVDIKKEVPLVRNDLVVTPFATGIRHCSIVLPFREYTDEELDIILVHELLHCRQKDLKWKIQSVWINLLHIWNPFAYWMRKRMSEMAECVCDNRVCTYCKEKFDAKTYFSIILSEATTDDTAEDDFYAGLGKSASELRRRVASMKNYQMKGKLKKSLAAVTVCVFMIGSSLTAYAAGDRVIDVQHTWYEETRVTEESATQTTIYTVLPEDVVEVPTTIIDTAVGARTTNSIDWSVPAGSKYMTGEFSLSANDTVSISAKSTPSGKTVRIGIQYQDGSQYYMNCTGAAGGTITAKYSGLYRFYVENVSNVEVRVEASYIR